MFNLTDDSNMTVRMEVAKNEGFWSGCCHLCEHLVKTNEEVSDDDIIFIGGLAWTEILCPNCNKGKIPLRYAA